MRTLIFEIVKYVNVQAHFCALIFNVKCVRNLTILFLSHRILGFTSRGQLYVRHAELFKVSDLLNEDDVCENQ